MICKNCGNEFRDDETRCPVCGGENEIVKTEEKTEQKESSAPKNLGMASLICAVMAGLGYFYGAPTVLLLIASFVTGLISNSQAKARGMAKSDFATAGLITALVVSILQVIAWVTATILVGVLMLIYVLYFLFLIGFIGAIAESASSY